MRRFAGAVKRQRLMERRRLVGRVLPKVREGKWHSVQEHLDIACILIVSIERDPWQPRQRRDMPALDQTLARSHPGPKPELACELELALCGTALVAIGIAEMAARHAEFALDARQALRDLVARFWQRQLRQRQVTAGMGTDRDQRIGRQAAYFVPGHHQPGAKTARVEARRPAELGNDGAGVLFLDAA